MYESNRMNYETADDDDVDDDDDDEFSALMHVGNYIAIAHIPSSTWDMIMSGGNSRCLLPWAIAHEWFALGPNVYIGYFVYHCVYLAHPGHHYANRKPRTTPAAQWRRPRVLETPQRP